MATDKLFLFAGVSKFQGMYKIRFANDAMRIKILDKNGHEDIRLFALPFPLSKVEAVLAIRHLDEVQDKEAQLAIEEYLLEHGKK